jgi:hypothetical protein
MVIRNLFVSMLALGMVAGMTTLSYAADNDGDTFDEAVDCDDTNSAIFPGAPETCDGVDQDCDATIDEGCQVGVQDAFQCWKASDLKDPPFVFDPVNTGADNFGIFSLEVKTPAMVCGPASLNGSPVHDPAGVNGTHLCCYVGRLDPKKMDTKPTASITPTGIGQELGNPQTSKVVLKRRDVFCVPCTKTLLP